MTTTVKKMVGEQQLPNISLFALQILVTVKKVGGGGMPYLATPDFATVWNLSVESRI